MSPFPVSHPTLMKKRTRTTLKHTALTDTNHFPTHIPMNGKYNIAAN